jgi:hypothetical protein
VLVQLDELGIANPGVLVASDQGAVALGNFVLMIHVGIYSFEEGVRALDVAGPRNTLQFTQTCTDIATVLDHVTCDDEVKRVVPERHVLNDTEHKRPIPCEGCIVALASDLIGV